MKKKLKKVEKTLLETRAPQSDLLIFWVFMIFLIIFAIVLFWNNLAVSEVARQNNMRRVDSAVVRPGLKMTQEIVNEDRERNTIKESNVLTLNEAQKNFDELTFLASPDGKSIAYIISNETSGRRTVVLNGRAGASYDDIIFMKFSPDSQRFAYGAKVNGKSLVVLDGQEGKLYDWIFEPHFFSPDNKYFIYKARNSAGDILVFNKEESQVYDRIYNVAVSSAETEIIFYARQGDEIWRGELNITK